ncbi:MAG: hypothetical protein A2Y95_05605 [Deltaproteobacteria bacterium RBG_13_65_10]|nr:MAG: hypothetical protein A2Y95_05605 [Deltaproteobacteria bacterium RBG_13_65_10]
MRLRAAGVERRGRSRALPKIAHHPPGGRAEFLLRRTGARWAAARQEPRPPEKRHLLDSESWFV